MENEFINKLEENEKLLFYGVSDVSKTDKQYDRFLLFFLILILFWKVTIPNIKKQGILDFNVLIILIVLSILTISFIYGLVRNILLKCKNEYFVTNKRIALYNSKKGFRIENISDIEHIGISREKDNYGDITFNFFANSLIEQIINGMEFIGIENPRKIVEIICDINKGIHVYDDRPTIMGKKI